jgi:hypothetical protein
MALPPEILARAEAEAAKAPEFTPRQLARLSALIQQAPAEVARAS